MILRGRGCSSLIYIYMLEASLPSASPWSGPFVTMGRRTKIGDGRQPVECDLGLHSEFSLRLSQRCNTTCLVPVSGTPITAAKATSSSPTTLFILSLVVKPHRLELETLFLSALSCVHHAENELEFHSRSTQPSPPPS